VRVVVIGAGLLGSAVADELAAAGASVTVLEAGTPGGGTSGSSFAWINAQDKAPEGYFALNAEGVATYPTLARELGGDWFHPGGDLLVGRGPGAARVAEKIERHRAWGYAVRELDREAIARLEPDLDASGDGDLCAAHFPDEAWIDPPRLIDRRLARAVERGADVRTDLRVTGFESTGGRLTAVTTTDGTVAGDAVVLAAGIGAEALAETIGVRLPMSPNPGLLATTAPTTARLSHVVHAGGVALRPDGDGRILVSSREVDAALPSDTRSLEPDSDPVGDLLARAARVLPALGDAHVERVRIGVRSVATDGLPVAGYAPGVDNLYLLVAHSGATLAPVLGRLVAAEVLGGQEAALDPYRPARFG
jgi:glycine/D-amino acid oxidase-like deaminating enzyme